MNFSKHTEEVKLDLQIAPLIDVVFLLLIYFMVTAALIKKEGDIPFMLPSAATSSVPITQPVEVLIHITIDGVVEVDGMQFSKDDRELEDMSVQIIGLQQMAKNQGSVFYVSILPHRDVLHERIIDVMDACAAARVKSLTFSKAL